MSLGITIWFFAFQLMFPALLLSGQEPAYYNRAQAARFNASPGYFHYIVPCLQDVRTVDPSGTAIQTKEQKPALCWPVRVVTLHIVEGKIVPSAVVPGSFIVSATQVQFNPIKPADAGTSFTYRPGELQTKHTDGTSYATLARRDVGYQFAFTDTCIVCVPGKIPAEPKGPEVDKGYKLFADSLMHFDETFKRVQDVATQIRVEIAPENQPTLHDPPEAMGLYSTLNRHMAEACGEEAKGCLTEYSKYQACESGHGKECGVAPVCSATCALSYKAILSMKGLTCTSPKQDSATVFPDWEETISKPGAKAMHYPNMPDAPKSGPMGFLGGPIGAPCTVFSAYEVSWMTHMGPSMAGLAMGGLPHEVATPVPGTKDMMRVSSSTMQGLLLKRVDPVYSPVAKAAHVGGAVVLRAIISTEGDVTDLSVVDGPDLLRSSAIEAVKQWKYKPFQQGGKPITVETTVTVYYALGI